MLDPTQAQQMLSRLLTSGDSAQADDQGRAVYGRICLAACFRAYKDPNDPMIGPLMAIAAETLMGSVEKDVIINAPPRSTRSR